jgi:hypothetical protein
VKLTKFRRADDALFNLIWWFDSIPNLTSKDFQSTSHITCYLCDIYAILARGEFVLIRHWWIVKLLVTKVQISELKCQHVTSQIDTPAIGKINSDTIRTWNNERFNIVGIEGDVKTIQNNYKRFNFNAAEKLDISQIFRVAYAGQEVTINQPYWIHQWNRYTNIMKYVVLSRATTRNVDNSMININLYVDGLSVNSIRHEQLE